MGVKVRILVCAVAALAVPLALAVPVRAAVTRHVVVYYQTQYDGSRYVSPLGLTQHQTHVTDVLVAALHLDANRVVHLNNDPPSAAKFTRMWKDLGSMRAAGVHVLVMVGGAAQGSFHRLDTAFGTYYPLLRNVIRTYHLDGVDLDVEESMSLAGMERLIDALRTDFGSRLLITLAPVATALSGGGNLSGFSYDRLYRDRGAKISWFNAQFYNGWGSLASTASYDAVIRHGVVPAAKVVAGAVTNPANGGGYVAMSTLQSTLRKLAARYPGFAGAAGWEYFNSLPGGKSAPWTWAGGVSSGLGLH
jgi:glycosyl hydrolase family 18 (putative chitinase)